MQGTRTVEPVNLHPGLIQAFIQLSEEKLYTLNLARFWHPGGLPALCHSVHSYLYRQTDTSTANLMPILKDK